MTRTLLLIEQINTFEQFFAKTASRETVDIVSPYCDVATPFGYYLRAISKRLPGHFFHKKWLADWSKNMDQYDVIVVFDNALTKKLLTYIGKIICDKRKLKIWLWNVPNENLDYLTSHYQVYCFDKTYAEQYGLKFINQFYWLEQDYQFDTESIRDCYFIGADKGRSKELWQLAHFFNQQEITYQFDVLSDKECIGASDFNYITESLPYDSVLTEIKRSRAIVEINKAGQKGITLRALESVFFSKKLITNNSDIKNHDFYQKENIFILGEDSPELLSIFLSKPYVNLKEDILKNYQFKTWLEKISRD